MACYLSGSAAPGQLYLICPIVRCPRLLVISVITIRRMKLRLQVRHRSKVLLQYLIY